MTMTLLSFFFILKTSRLEWLLSHFYAFIEAYS
jgi:hypothetical protein